jgi:hypothetical protein
MPAPLKVSRIPNRKEEKYASHANFAGPDRCGRIALAGESFHPYAGNHQVDLELRRRHLRRIVAFERVWALSHSFPDPHRHIDKR